MLIKDILPINWENEIDRNCSSCYINEEAQYYLEKLGQSIECPSCKTLLDFKMPLKIEPVFQELPSQHNIDNNDHFDILPTIFCEKCETDIGLYPIKLSENYNHNEIYTHGIGISLSKNINFTKIEEVISPLIKQYLERDEKNENIHMANLCWWIAAAVEKLISSYLKDNGFLRV